MNLREIKSFKLEPGDQYNLGPEDEQSLRIKSVRNWFGKDKEHVGLTLEDSSGEWISATVFGAPSEIAKMEGEWVPIRPAGGSKSGVWIECREFEAKKGPDAGKMIRKNELKIMVNCFRWEEASSTAPRPTPSAPGSSSGPRASGGAMTDVNYIAWLEEMVRHLEVIPVIGKDPQAVQAACATAWIASGRGELELTLGRHEETKPPQEEEQDYTEEGEPLPF